MMKRQYPQRPVVSTGTWQRHRVDRPSGHGIRRLRPAANPARGHQDQISVVRKTP